MLNRALTVVYSLAKNVPCYDVYNALMAGEQRRRQLDYRWINVEFVPGPNEGFGEKDLWPYTRAAREHMMRHVCMPLCALLPSVHKTTWLKRPEQATEGIKHGTRTFAEFMTAYEAGIRPLRPNIPYERQHGLVTITLREAEHWPSRNSNVLEWMKAAHHLVVEGYKVVFVRDTHKAHEPLVGFTTLPDASLKISHRAALYCSADVNLFVNNGPAWFSLTLDAPTLIVKPSVEDAGKAAKAETLEKLGVLPTLKGAPGHQRVVPVSDTADNILAAFADFMERRQAA